MKKESKTKEPKELSEIKAEIITCDISIERYGKEIIADIRVGTIFRLKKIESELIAKRKALTIKVHQMENKLIDLGRGPAFGLYRVPQVKHNQYSN